MSVTRYPARLSRLGLHLRRALWPPDASNVAEWNIHYLRTTIFWAGIVGAAATFNGNFAVRLGASNRLIGLMASIPALFVVLLTLPAARLIESRRNRLPWMVGSIFLHRLTYLAIALMPFLVVSHRAEVFVGLLLYSNVVLAPFHAGWESLLADVVPERRRANVFAQRNMIHAGVIIVTVPLMGRLLDAIIFPLGYQIAYGLGFLASMIGTWQLTRLHPPEAVVPSRRLSPWQAEGVRWKVVRRILAENDSYVRLVVNTLLLDWGAWMIGPLYIIYYLRHLGASDSWVGTLTSVANLSAMGGYYIGQRLIGRWGESRVLRWTAPFCGFFPLWVGAWRALPLILVAAAINNVVMPAVNLSHFNTLLKVCPAERRPSYISLYSSLMNVGAFVAPMIGVALADHLSIPLMLLLGGVMRTLGGFLFSLWPVRVTDSALTS